MPEEAQTFQMKCWNVLKRLQESNQTRPGTQAYFSLQPLQLTLLDCSDARKCRQQEDEEHAFPAHMSTTLKHYIGCGGSSGGVVAGSVAGARTAFRACAPGALALPRFITALAECSARTKCRCWSRRWSRWFTAEVRRRF